MAAREITVEGFPQVLELVRIECDRKKLPPVAHLKLTQQFALRSRRLTITKAQGRKDATVFQTVRPMIAPLNWRAAVILPGLEIALDSPLNLRTGLYHLVYDVWESRAEEVREKYPDSVGHFIANYIYARNHGEDVVRQDCMLSSLLRMTTMLQGRVVIRTVR